MAEAANTAGNAAYKEGKFGKAEEHYLEATRKDGAEPKYPSNASAALFEQGKYVPCVETIIKAWRRLSDKNNSRMPTASDALAIKPATRLAKCNLNGFTRRLISPHATPSTAEEQQRSEIEARIEQFVYLGREDEDSKVKEMLTVWQQWRAIRFDCAQHSTKECKRRIANAKERLRALKIMKSQCIPLMEYFRFGHDPVISLMAGPNDGDDYAMDLRTPTEMMDKDGNIALYSFLFGGSGDSRHVFGTLIHFADWANETRTNQQVETCAGLFTLVDIHPATLARTLVMLRLLQLIMGFRGSRDKILLAELHATLFYVFNAMVMPEYCRRIVMEVSKALIKDLPQGPDYSYPKLYINDQSLAEILGVLRYWSTPLKKSAKIFLTRNAGVSSSAQRALELQDPYSSKPKPGAEELLLRMMMMQRDVPNPNERPKGAETCDVPYEMSTAEGEIYDRTKALLPPKVLLSRTPAPQKLVKGYKKAGKDLFDAAAREVEETWLPNPTLFELHSTEAPEFGGGYPQINGGPYDTMLSFARFTKQYQRGPDRSKKTGYSIMSQFFEVLAEALWSVSRMLKFEILVGDVITGVPRLVAGDFGKRPKEFPRTYSRIWLSNVPDYTHGILNTAVHLTPHIKPDCLILSNCLLNTGLFKTIHDLCYNYALVCTHALPSFLGCEIVNDQASPYKDSVIAPFDLPLPMKNLATKKQLHSWLSQVLLTTFINGKPPPPPLRVEVPNNLAAFIHLLNHLHRVGYPGHWLGDFLQACLEDKLATDAVPYTESLRTPPSERIGAHGEVAGNLTERRVRVGAWRAEFESILARVSLALPFAVSLPEGCAKFDDVGMYRAKVKAGNVMRNPHMFSLSSPLVRCLTSSMGMQPCRGLRCSSGLVQRAWTHGPAMSCGRWGRRGCRR
ncbi:unnamed protein product [Cyclocybe aegerita]|uniref:DUF4470 domain-containing protein n=1 Tax=Cyclocybe aegerita TaxID=1973307 RepID=A0A8S0XQ72_CYCAE|nr:unnamed protein product [Cyclocybe aegerita]